MLKVRTSPKDNYNSLPASHAEVWKPILGISCCSFQLCTMFFSHESTHPHCIVNNPKVIYRPFRQSCNYLFRSIAPKKGIAGDVATEDWEQIPAAPPR